MSDEELMHIAFADKRTVQEILRSIFNMGVQQGRADAIDEVIKECRDRTSHYLDGEPFKYKRELMDIAKYLKEQKNED